MGVPTSARRRLPTRRTGVGRRGRPGALAGVAATLLLVATTGCGSPSESADDEVLGVGRPLVSALEVDDEHLRESPARRRSGLSPAACGVDDPDDAWYVLRTWRITGDRYAQEPLFEAAAAHLTGEGFSVERYVAPTSGGRGIVATRGTIGTTVDVASNGATHIIITGGPCGAAYPSVAERYEPEPG